MRASIFLISGINVGFEQVMGLRVVTERAAALLVDKRMADHIGTDVRHVAKREGEELLETILTIFTAAQRLSLIDKRLAHPRWVAVVGHVAPEKRLLIPAFLDTGVE